MIGILTKTQTVCRFIVIQTWILSLEAIGWPVETNGLCAHLLDKVTSNVGLPITGIEIFPWGKETCHNEFLDLWFLHDRSTL